MSIKYRGKKYFIEIFNFNNSIKSMFINLDGIKIFAISSKLTNKEISKELHILLSGKRLRIIKRGV